MSSDDEDLGAKPAKFVPKIEYYESDEDEIDDKGGLVTS